MPLTPVHTLAVVPFWKYRRRLPFEALAIGAMVPDIPLFFPIANYGHTHSPIGAFTSCLALGLGGWLAFELIFRIPLRALLPARVQQRIPRRNLRFIRTLGGWAMLSIAIVIGAFTHQVWDAFTHVGRWGTELIPVLNEHISLFGQSMPGYRLLQNGFSIIGIPLLIIFAMWALVRAPTGHVADKLHPALRLVFCGVMSIAVLHAAVKAMSFNSVLYHFVTGLGRDSLFAMLCYSVTLTVSRRFLATYHITRA